MTDTGKPAKRTVRWSRWGLAAFPAGLLFGVLLGGYFGSVAIGLAIGAALGLSGAAALFAAAVAFGSRDEPARDRRPADRVR